MDEGMISDEIKSVPLDDPGNEDTSNFVKCPENMKTVMEIEESPGFPDQDGNKAKESVNDVMSDVSSCCIGNAIVPNESIMSTTRGPQHIVLPTSLRDVASRDRQPKSNNANQKQSVCKSCNYKSSAKYNVRRHVTRVDCSLNHCVCHICEVCGDKTGSKGGLKVHMQTVHKDYKPFKCEMCDYKAGNKGHLKSHVQTVHQAYKPFTCEICGYKTSTKVSLKNHVQNVHQCYKPFTCEICDYKTGYKSCLKVHVRIVHQGYKPHTCEICNYKTGVKIHLKTHMQNVHQGYKPFACGICDYKSGEKGNLKKHIQNVHEGYKPFTCEICDFKTFAKGNLNRHVKRVHEGYTNLDRGVSECV